MPEPFTNWVPTGVNTFNENTLGPAGQANFHAPYCPIIEFPSHQFDREDTMGNDAKVLPEVNVNNIHCSPLTY